AYATSFASRRCLVPADGWYEWARDGGRRQPYFMTSRDGSVLAFAGLWTVWGEGAARLLTCTILTTAALGDLAAVHDRMPLLLPRERWPGWLGGAEPAPPPAEHLAALEIRPVGAAVGDVRNDGPHLVERVPTEAVDLTLF